MALKTVILTEDFEVWLKAYNSIVDTLNSKFTIVLNNNNFESIDSTANQFTVILTENQHILNNARFEPGNALLTINGLKMTRVIDFDDTVAGTITIDAGIDTNVDDIIDIQLV